MAEVITKPKLLIHACCAPCSTVPLDRLSDDYDISFFFFGPNIHPYSEYNLRLEDQRKFCTKMGVHLIEGSYNKDTWDHAVLQYRDLPEGSMRCQSCFRMRMEETARVADEQAFDYFTVTMTVSRHKDSQVLNTIGQEVAGNFSAKYLAEDFKKQDGYGLSVRKSNELGLRRQNYCGCFLSKQEAELRRMKREAKQ